MTYYEIVSFLDNMITKPIDSKLINELNNIEINLEGNRYYRFIGQINYVLTERLRLYMDRLIDKIKTMTFSKEDLILEMSNLTNEVDFLKQISAINLIKKENHKEFVKSIIKNNNELIEGIKEYFSDEEYLRIIDGYILTEV